MKALKFLIWLRDEVHCIPQSKERAGVGLPSNAELRRWIQKGVVLVNGSPLSSESVVEWPVTQLILFPKNDKQRVSLVGSLTNQAPMC